MKKKKSTKRGAGQAKKRPASRGGRKISDRPRELFVIPPWTLPVPPKPKKKK